MQPHGWGGNRERLYSPGPYLKGVKMFVLTRQKDESIMIGDDVEITIVDVRGDKVRLGINAPRSVSVHRKEIWEAIQREKAARAAEKENSNGQQPDT